ncbi:DNA polymerase delta subunit 4 [Trichophyton equinum CBS 127.97]|uniref:DNA polymerase delta subunit 4 n=1 Tax=Trichophyton equinum (strain ATCC MYA-4606 / CBS 127.97) TaxID=559882 RepID=F2Q1J5_TRIEC|nr:DNA polymerase delta subunit 4 [Trichophyton equinum CBS 127.97]
MAPRRKAADSRKSNQATLQFGTQSKISKPFSNASIPGKDLKQRSPSPKEISLPTHSLPKKQDDEQQQLQEATAEVKVTPASTTSTAVVHEQARAEAALPKSKEDEQAEALTVKQLHAYWRAEERKRTASRVHQADLSIEERILRHFDLCSQYGPCIGIARIKRWRRAHALGLNPPIEVLAVLLKEETREKASEKAYIDELLS